MYYCESFFVVSSLLPWAYFMPCRSQGNFGSVSLFFGAMPSLKETLAQFPIGCPLVFKRSLPGGGKEVDLDAALSLAKKALPPAERPPDRADAETTSAAPR